MKIGGYSFTNPRRFHGLEGYGFECDINIGRKKIGFYHDDGNGGEGYLSASWEGDAEDSRRNKKLMDEFEKFAISICPPYPADEEFDLPEHNGDIDRFFCLVEQWLDYEKSMRRLMRKNPSFRYGYVVEKKEYETVIGLLNADSPEEALNRLKEAKRCRLKGFEDIERVLVIDPGNNFEFDRFPEWTAI